MVTLKDVAQHAQVSVSTASRILSNSPKEKFTEATQLKVLRASVELGYRPNFAARALASGKSKIIAAVFPRVYDSPFTALASLQILSGIESFCSQNGYHVLISSPSIVTGSIDSSFTDLLASGYPDGIILDGHFNIDPIMKILRDMALPTVILGDYPHPYYLRSDNFLGGNLLMQHVLKLGHRAIGLIGLADGISPAADQRLQGMAAALHDAGLDYATMPRVDGTFSTDSGTIAAGQLMSANPHLTALIALNDRMAIGAIRQLQTMKYCVPDEVTVVGYDDLPQSRDSHPPLTTINQHLSEWGSLTMNMLLELLEGQEPAPVVLSPRLIVRKSSAPVYVAQPSKLPSNEIHPNL